MNTPKRQMTPRRIERTVQPITHEGIDRDLAAFEKSGGRIEMLGNTNVFKRLIPTPKKPSK